MTNPLDRRIVALEARQNPDAPRPVVMMFDRPMPAAERERFEAERATLEAAGNKVITICSVPWPPRDDADVTFILSRGVAPTPAVLYERITWQEYPERAAVLAGLIRDHGVTPPRSATITVPVPTRGASWPVH